MVARVGTQSLVGAVGTVVFRPIVLFTFPVSMFELSNEAISELHRSMLVDMAYAPFDVVVVVAGWTVRFVISLVGHVAVSAVSEAHTLFGGKMARKL